MLIVMRTTASEEDLERVKQYLIDRDFDFHQSTGANRVIIGPTSSIFPTSIWPPRKSVTDHARTPRS